MSVGRPLITSLRELEPEACFAVVLADRPSASLAAFIDVPLEAVEAAPLAPAGDLPLVDDANENSGTSDLPID